MVDQTSQFYAILTTVGAAKQANADALGIPWKITQMAVGDGNPTGLENPALPMPDASARALLNEWRRAPLNQLKVDDKNSAVIVAEQVIPADAGGRWIRELALFDADGDMVAVANCAPTYKPLLNQGSGRTQVVRMNLIVSSSSNVQLKIDPSVVLATREWVTEELAKQDFKHSVLAATTTSITLSGLQTVDGVALSAGARVLVKNQVAGKDNGLYLVVASGAWTRSSDADISAKVTPGMLVLVEKGAVNADSGWQLVTDGPITLGVSTLAYEMVFGRTGVVGGTYRSVSVDVYGRVVAASNPTTVAGFGLTDVYTKTQIDQSLALKANLTSPNLLGVPTCNTAPVFSSTTQIANTDWVARRGVQYSSFFSYKGATAGIAADVGGVVHFSHSPADPRPNAYSLPNATANNIPIGATIRVQNWGIYDMSLERQGADQMQESIDGAWSAATRIIPPDSYVDCLYVGSNCWLLTGTGVMGKTRPFQASLTTSGFQVLPSGLIIQWNRVTVAQQQTATFALPIVFPNAFLVCTAIKGYAISTAEYSLGAGGTVSNISITNTGPSAGLNQGAMYIAIGY